MNTFEKYLKEIGEYGVVEQIQHPVVSVTGLPTARPGELIVAESGEMGQVFSIERESITLFLFSKNPLSVGTRVARTNVQMSVPVGESLLGQVINPLGEPLFSKRKKIEVKKRNPIEVPIKRVDERTRITQPLSTGTSIVDLLIPLGKGQRELVIGDRKTGKTAFLQTVTKQQVQEGSIVIYVAIGKKKSEITKLVEGFEKSELLKSMVVIATDSQDPATLIFLSPMVAMTIAEAFRDEGKDTVVLFDDLSTHARFYREISLLSNRFPGRESYPGDIFYTHAKLLERAGNFTIGDKVVAITCLPVVETVEGDFTGYIQTNLMGITDGHIYFDNNAYYDGRRPAINIALSVTRAGKQTQSSLKKEIGREMNSFLAQYEKIINFSHFGAELSEEMVKRLKLGEKLYELFEQHYDLAIPESVQLVMVGMVYLGHFDDVPVSKMNVFKKQLTARSTTKQFRDLVKNFDELKNIGELKEFVQKYLKDILAICATHGK